MISKKSKRMMPEFEDIEYFNSQRDIEDAFDD